MLNNLYFFENKMGRNGPFIHRQPKHGCSPHIHSLKIYTGQLFFSSWIFKSNRITNNGEVDQKDKKSGVIRQQSRYHFNKYKGNLNPELQADMSTSGCLVNFLLGPQSETVKFWPVYQGFSDIFRA